MLETTYSLEQIFQSLLYVGGVLSLFYLSMVLRQVYKILRDVSKISSSTSDITSRVHSLITGPIDMLLSVVSKLSPIIEKSIRDYIKKAKNNNNQEK
jgi:hypothetical protein